MIVDDEQLARLHLRLMLAREPNVEVVGEGKNGAEAAEIYESMKPDLVFLDIHLRNETGFDILTQRLQSSAKVIFVTAFAEHAARAFDVHAVDYLLKPVNPARLHESIERFRHSMSTTTQPIVSQLVPLGTSGNLVACDEILYIQAANQNTQVTTESGATITVRESLRHWKEKLPSPPFAKLERSLIVNLSKIVSVKYQTRAAQIQIGKATSPLHVGAKAALRLREILSAN